MKFSKEQHQIWQTLFKAQIDNVQKFACREYLDGFAMLELPTDHIPSLSELNQKITPKTGWKTARTKIRYSDTMPWYQYFARKEFIVTDYLRSWEELEFTPEPDMFHDIFGHLPFLTLPEHTQLFDMFTDAYLKANKKQQQEIQILGWFSYEFGIIKQKDQLKIFGTGILSSKGETEHVMAGKTPILPFTVKNVLTRNKAIDTFNKELFVFDSLEALKQELKRHFSTIKGKKRQLETSRPIVDKEMDLDQYKTV